MKADIDGGTIGLFLPLPIWIRVKQFVLDICIWRLAEESLLTGLLEKKHFKVNFAGHLEEAQKLFIRVEILC